jgi:hypothetical protein
MVGKKKEIIQSWYSQVVEEGERGRAHELHVDQIDESSRSKGSWVSAALEAFDIACGIRDANSNSTRWTVVVAFFLTSESVPLDVTFHNRAGMEDVFSDVPPALFLWPAGDEFWVRAETNRDKTENLNLKVLKGDDLFGKQCSAFKCFYMECMWDGLDEYFRAVYLAG